MLNTKPQNTEKRKQSNTKQLYNVAIFWAKKMTQRIKGLLHKHEDWSLDSRIHIEPNAVYNTYRVHAYNPTASAVKGEAESGQHSEASLVCSVTG